MEKNALVRGASQYLATLKEAQESLKDNQILYTAPLSFIPVDAESVEFPIITLIEYKEDIEKLIDEDPSYGGMEGVLTGELWLPSKIKEIPARFFANNWTAEKIHLPEGLKKIGEEAFIDNQALDLSVPDGVEEIADHAFERVKHITYHGSAEGAPWGAESMN